MKYLDLIERLGVAGAHPGGFEATKALLEQVKLPPNAKVLEAGCGAGESACFLAAAGVDVTAVDRRPRMLELARERAEAMGVKVAWVLGDIERLPFPEGAFDVVFAESVTIFANVNDSLREYFRVLKPQGMLIDCEITLLRELSPDLSAQLVEFMELSGLYKAQDWIRFLENAGFRVQHPLRMHPLWNPAGSTVTQEADPALFSNAEISAGAAMYFQLMLESFEHFGVGTYVAVRITPPLTGTDGDAG